MAGSSKGGVLREACQPLHTVATGPLPSPTCPPRPTRDPPLVAPRVWLPCTSARPLPVAPAALRDGPIAGASSVSGSICRALLARLSSPASAGHTLHQSAASRGHQPPWGSAVLPSLRVCGVELNPFIGVGPHLSAGRWMTSRSI